MISGSPTDLFKTEFPYKNFRPTITMVYFSANTALSCSAVRALLLCDTVSRLVGSCCGTHLRLRCSY